MVGQYPYATAQLDELRNHIDSKGDKVVELLLEHYSEAALHEIFRTINRHVHLNDFPEFLNEYLDDMGRLPKWVDMDKIQYAQQLFFEYGRDICLTLLCRSLPMCYICANGAEVLDSTARLIDHPQKPEYTRRLLETLQFFINICSDPNFMDPLGSAQSSIKRVRLIHAAIRKYIKETIDWPKERGLPINQEDELMTIGAFSIQVIFGLERIGIHWGKKEKESWCHLWTAVGYQMGIEEKYLPGNFEQFREMSENIYRSQSKYSESGIALVSSVTTFMSSILPYHLLDNFAYATVKHMNSPEYHGIMGLTKKHPFWDWLIPKLMKDTLAVDQTLVNSSWLLKKIVERINHWLFNDLAQRVLKGEQYFYIPNSLKQ